MNIDEETIDEIQINDIELAQIITSEDPYQELKLINEIRAQKNIEPLSIHSIIRDIVSYSYEFESSEPSPSYVEKTVPRLTLTQEN